MGRNAIWLESFLEDAVKYYKEGHSLKQCADYFGDCSSASLHRLFKKNNIQLRDNSVSVSMRWDEDRKSKKSEWLINQYKNPNSIYNSDEFNKSRIRYGSDCNFYGQCHSGENNPMYGKTGELSPFYKKKRPAHVMEEIHKALKIRYDNGDFIIWNKGKTKDNDKRILGISNKLKDMHADPNYVYDGKFNGWASVRRGLAKDNHKCQSKNELIFDDMLYENQVQHNIHPRVPNRRRFADYLVSGKYIELDGIGREISYFKEKYANSNIKPIIVQLDRNSPEKNLLIFEDVIYHLICDDNEICDNLMSW